jgi:hypothetical protein
VNQKTQELKPKVLIPISAFTLESILNYLLLQKSTNARFVRNIIKLMDNLDRKAYEKDDYLETVLDAIISVAALRYDGVSNPQYIKNFLQEGNFNKKHITHIYQKFEPMERSECDHLGKIVRDYVDYSYIFQTRGDILAAYDEIMNTNGKMSEIAIEKLKGTLEDLLSSMRRADVTRTEDESVSISAKPGKEIKTELGKLYDELTDPRNIFKTGLKELNRFLNGGVRRKGMLIIYGPTNSFKSGALLYFALWIIQFNPGLKSKIPGKKLAVVIITMENTRDEELERIHAIYTQGNVDVREISKETWLNQWEQIFPSLGNDIELHIIYKSPIDTTTLDIQASIEELEEDNNLEVMAVIIDHLGNIKSRNRSSNTNEWRDTVQIAYELSDWGKSSNRAIITAMHTNSTIDDKLAEAIQMGKTNLVRMLGRHCIADAKYIDRAVDLSIYILKEFNNIDGQWYLGWKYEKQRGKRDRRGSNVFYHRLENDITLQYDEGTPLYKSFPCIPGTESTIQTAQLAAAGVATPGFPPNPFGNSFGNNKNNGPFGMMPVLNKHPEVDFTPVNTEEIEDITDADFKDDSEEIDNMVNNAGKETEIPYDPYSTVNDDEVNEGDFSSDGDDDIANQFAVIDDNNTNTEEMQ